MDIKYNQTENTIELKDGLKTQNWLLNVTMIFNIINSILYPVFVVEKKEMAWLGVIWISIGIVSAHALINQIIKKGTKKGGNERESEKGNAMPFEGKGEGKVEAIVEPGPWRPRRARRFGLRIDDPRDRIEHALAHRVVEGADVELDDRLVGDDVRLGPGLQCADRHDGCFARADLTRDDGLEPQHDLGAPDDRVDAAQIDRLVIDKKHVAIAEHARLDNPVGQHGGDAGPQHLLLHNFDHPSPSSHRPLQK